jgi:hypothetical protein
VSSGAAADYDAAVRRLVAAGERQSQSDAADGARDGVQRAMRDAHAALQRIGATGAIRPPQPTKESGSPAELRTVLRQQEQTALAAAREIDELVARIEANALDDDERRRRREDWTWRVPVPFASGLVAMLAVASAAPRFMAVLVGVVVATVALAVTTPHALASLRPAAGRPGLESNDVGLVCAGTCAAVLGAIAAVLPARAGSGADQLLAIAIAVAGGVTASRRLSMLRRART